MKLGLYRYQDFVASIMEYDIRKLSSISIFPQKICMVVKTYMGRGWVENQMMLRYIPCF
jgi:hypothetical protein